MKHDHARRRDAKTGRRSTQRRAHHHLRRDVRATGDVERTSWLVGWLVVLWENKKLQPGNTHKGRS